MIRESHKLPNAPKLDEQINLLRGKALDIVRKNWSEYPDFRQDRIDIYHLAATRFQGQVDKEGLGKVIGHIIMTIPFDIASQMSADKSLIYMGASHLVLTVAGGPSLDEFKELVSGLATNFLSLKLTIEDQDFVRKIATKVFDKSVLMVLFDMTEDKRGVLTKRAPEKGLA